MIAWSPRTDWIIFCALCFSAAAVFSIWAKGYSRGRRFFSLVWGFVLLLMWAGIFRADVIGVRRQEEIQSQLQGFAPTYAQEFELMGHHLVDQDTRADDLIYLSLIEAQKRWLKVNGLVNDIYTMRRLDDGKVILVVDSETDYNRDGKYEGERERRTPIGEIYEAGDVLKKAFDSKKAVFDGVPYEDKWGSWVSAYVPLRGPDGKSDGILGVDYSAKQWISAISLARYSVFRFFLLFVLILLSVAGTFLVMRHEGEKLRKAKQDAEEAAKAKSRFLANMSHEIRTPLNAVIGFSRQLSGTGLDAAQNDYLRTIGDSGEILLNIVNDVLDYSKLEARQRKVENVDFDLEELVRTILRVCSVRAADGLTALSCDYDKKMPRRFIGDVSAVRQILLNFVGNAVKFTPKGEVRVEVRPSSAGGGVRISVHDTGIGIEKEKLTDIFKPFEQADASTTRRYGGTGLGLSISKALAELVGGTVDAVSEPGKGSVFSVDLPLKPAMQRPAEDPTERSARAADETRFKGLKVLVAEDNPINQKLIGIVLGKLGCIVETAMDGKEAVDKVFTRSYDLCLMDLQMPVMSGIDAAELIRSKEGFDRFPIVALTAASAEDDQRSCRRAGMRGYLLKPIDPETLKQAILACVQ